MSNLNFHCNFFPVIGDMGEAVFLAEVAVTEDTLVARAAGAAFPVHDAGDRPLAALARLRLPSPECFARGAGVTGEAARDYDQAYLALVGGTAQPVRALTTLLRLEGRRQGRLRGLKRRAADRGLAYWPALLDAKVDPKAFVAAETVLAACAGGRYGDPLPATDPTGVPARHRGGWEGAGHYGVSADQVARAWYQAGCRDGRKFRRTVAGLYRLRPEVAHAPMRKWVSKRDSAARVAHVLRGVRWAEANVKGGAWRFAKRALVALGRIAPWARWAAVSSGVLEARATLAVIGLMDLNWAEVDRLQKGPRWRRAQHTPSRLQWQYLQGVDLPAGIAKELAVAGLPMGIYRALCVRAGVAPLAGPDHPGGLRQPAMNLARLFGRLGEMQYFAALHGATLDADGIHDLGQFPLPTGRFDAAGWRRRVFKHPKKTRARAGQWGDIERELGRVPATLTELRQVAARLLSAGIETLGDLEVATIAAKVGLGQSQFEDYRGLMRGPLKAWEAVPAVRVTGAQVGHEGDWLLRQLAHDDPLGPMLGVVTYCSAPPRGGPVLCPRRGGQPTLGLLGGGVPLPGSGPKLGLAGYNRPVGPRFHRGPGHRLRRGGGQAGPGGRPAGHGPARGHRRAPGGHPLRVDRKVGQGAGLSQVRRGGRHGKSDGLCRWRPATRHARGTGLSRPPPGVRG